MICYEQNITTENAYEPVANIDHWLVNKFHDDENTFYILKSDEIVIAIIELKELDNDFISLKSVSINPEYDDYVLVKFCWFIITRLGKHIDLNDMGIEFRRYILKLLNEARYFVFAIQNDERFIQCGIDDENVIVYRPSSYKNNPLPLVYDCSMNNINILRDSYCLFSD